jgi:hypothetical protein
VVSGVPQLSVFCAREDHDRCPHWVGMGVRGRCRPRPEVVFCDDPCHGDRGCPLAGRRKADRDEWSARCTCPGAEDSRQSFDRAAERRRDMAALVADVDLADRPDAGTIESRLIAASRARGEEPPPGLGALSAILAARSGRRGTRSVRLLGLGAGVVGRAVRWAWQYGTEGDPEHQSLRPVVAGSAALLGVAALLTGGAVRNSGWRRVAWATAAVPVWLCTARVIALGVLVATLMRRAESAPPSSGARPVRGTGLPTVRHRRRPGVPGPGDTTAAGYSE